MQKIVTEPCEAIDVDSVAADRPSHTVAVFLPGELANCNWCCRPRTTTSRTLRQFASPKTATWVPAWIAILGLVTWLLWVLVVLTWDLLDAWLQQLIKCIFDVRHLVLRRCSMSANNYKYSIRHLRGFPCVLFSDIRRLPRGPHEKPSRGQTPVKYQ